MDAVNDKHLETALHSAVNMFYEVTSISGEPYILGILRLVNALDTPEEKVVALLDYIIDDTNYSIEEMIKKGIPQSCVDTSLLLKQDNNNYEEYIEKIAKNPVARKVKLAQLKQTCDPSRLYLMREKEKKRFPDYIKAIYSLESVR